MIPYINITLFLGEKALEITHFSTWRLVALTGIEAPDVEPYVEDYSSRDGAWYGGVHVHPRYITLTVQCQPKRRTEEERRRMIAFLNPRADGVLVVNRSGVTRKIAVHMAAGADFNQPNIRQNRLTVTIQLVAPDPYWQDVDTTEYDFIVRRPLINFPFSPVATSGIILKADAIEVTNSGDVPAGIVCRLKCSGGETVNPAVHSGDRKVQALLTLSGGDELVIDTNVGHKGIYLNGVRANVFSADSEFFQLPVGRSDISISADSGISYCTASLSYSFGYLGV